MAANALVGVNQGLAWSMTVIMKIDLAGPRSRGLAVGLNEFAGYLAVGITAFLTGYLASVYGLRPVPFYLGIGYAAVGLALSVFLVRDTRRHVELEIGAHPPTTARSRSARSSPARHCATAPSSRSHRLADRPRSLRPSRISGSTLTSRSRTA